MKNWMKISLWILVVAGVVTVLVFADREEKEKKYDIPKISIHVDGDAFLTEPELIDRLKLHRLIQENEQVGKLNIRKIEYVISLMPEVKNVKVFKRIGNEWDIQLNLRKPIARIFNQLGQSFYLDEDGFLMNRSSLHTARVLVFSGFIKDRFTPNSIDRIINNDSLKSIRNLDDIYRISSYVCNDAFLNAQIGQINLEKNGDFVLIPQVGGQKIIFGTARTKEDVAEKFKKLIVFYKEGLPFEGWDKYEVINLKYSKQIVCKKKNIISE
jgi:cell division protein FtsQ